MNRIITFFIIAFSIFSINTRAQTTVATCATDTIKLRANNHQYGTLEWEKSFDNINWVKILNAHDTIYKFKPTSSAYYRVSNKFPYCEPIISSVTLVQTKPKANVVKDRIVNDTITYVYGSSMIGATATWSIIEGVGGTIEQANNPSTRFIGFPNGTNGSNGNYKLLYTLQNECGVSTDTLNVKFVQNQYYSNIVVVDDTDTILSTPTEMENGDYIITFNSPVPTITNQTILIGIVGDGFMRKITNFTQTGNTFTMSTSQAKFEEILENGGLDVGQLYNIDPINETLSGRMANSNKLIHKPTREQLLNNENLKKGTHYFIIDDSLETDLNGVTYSKQKNNTLNRNSQNQTSNESGEEFVLFNFSGTTLYNQSGLTATLDGGLNFTPNFVADIETSLISLDKLNIGLDNATLTFDSKLTINGTATHDTGNFDFNLLTVHKNLIIVVGAVPFLVKIKTQLNGSLKAVTTGSVNFVNKYNKTYKVNAGLTYNNDTWDKYFNDDVTTTLNNDLTTSAQVTATLEVGPKLYFTINGVAGPYIDAKMTSDITACVSSQNNQDFNWDVNFDLGAKLTLGTHAYLFKKQLFDKSYTWEKRKMYNEKLPYLIEYISGNNQQYTIGQPLTNPIKVRVLSKQGYYIANVPVTFEALDNSGTVTQSEVITDVNGFAQTSFTPTANTVSKVQAFVKDCDFNYIQYAPLIFNATQTQAFDCTLTTLSASFYKQGNTLTPIGHLGVLPYTYSTDFYNFSSNQPALNIVAGQNYTGIVKDANGCVAFTHFYQTTNNCADSNLEIDVNILGKNTVTTAQGGSPPYLFALDNGSYGSTNTFNNLSIGSHLIRVKDNNDCVRQSIINVTNSTNNLVAYFEIPQTANAYQAVILNNLSNNATNYSWTFGNGQSSTATNPTITYSTTGIYTITLIATNGANTSTYSRQFVVSNSNTNNILGITMVEIPAGTFIMGSPTNEPNRGTDEIQHQVTLSAFKISKYEITCSQYATFLNSLGIGSNAIWADGPFPTQALLLAYSSVGLTYINGQWTPAVGKSNAPMAYVNWFGAVSFAQYAGGRLPTESEWEYAARGGTTTAFSTGNCLSNIQANYNWNYPQYWQNPQYGCVNTATNYTNTTLPVGTYIANSFGLHDMHGNIREWCSDWYDVYPSTNSTNPQGPITGTLKILRGGYFSGYAQHCRSAHRVGTIPTFPNSNGFRVVF